MDKVNQKMKKFTLRGVIDGFRSTVANNAGSGGDGAGSGSSLGKPDVGVEEGISSEHFQVAKTVRHGFPYQPTALAYDPVQHLLAIGTKSGSIRIFGRPGVDCHIKHEAQYAVVQLLFLINEGALVSICADDHLHLWSLRQKKPEIIHSLKFQRERITYCHLPFQSKWLYIGTERGNVHIVNIESFVVSGYIINWNKAIDLLCKTHPGPVIHLSDNLTDPNKLLIGYESGTLVLWDLKMKVVEFHYNCTESLRSVSWHNEGKQFVCSHGDGSLTYWNTRSPQRPQRTLIPHGKLGRDGKLEACRPITKVDLRTCRNGEPYIIFSGGMPNDKLGRTPSVTVMHDTSTTVLEMEHSIVDFVTICSTPWNNDFQDPYAVIILLQNDLIIADLTTPGYPCFENPYPIDISESPVTACLYFADCPVDLIPAFYQVGCKQKKTGYSTKEWPVKGGDVGSCVSSYSEIIITGHADGSVKFWDATCVSLQVLYKLRTEKVFDRPRCVSPDASDCPFVIERMSMCVETRLLCVASVSHVLLFKYNKLEATLEFPSLEISIIHDVHDDLESPDTDLPKQPSSLGFYSSNNSSATLEKDLLTSVKIKTGPRKWSTGYQPELCCALTWVNGEPPLQITSLSLSTKYGLLAFGNECGLALVDIVQKTCLLNISTPELYGSMDPSSSQVTRSPRPSKSPSRPPGPQGQGQGAEISPANQQLQSPVSSSTLSEDSRSPLTDQSSSSLVELAMNPLSSSSSSPTTGGDSQTPPIRKKSFSNDLEVIQERTSLEVDDMRCMAQSELSKMGHTDTECIQTHRPVTSVLQPIGPPIPHDHASGIPAELAIHGDHLAVRRATVTAPPCTEPVRPSRRVSTPEKGANSAKLRLELPLRSNLNDEVSCAATAAQASTPDITDLFSHSAAATLFAAEHGSARRTMSVPKSSGSASRSPSEAVPQTAPVIEPMMCGGTGSTSGSSGTLKHSKLKSFLKFVNATSALASPTSAHKKSHGGVKECGGGMVVGGIAGGSETAGTGVVTGTECMEDTHAEASTPPAHRHRKISRGHQQHHQQLMQQLQQQQQHMIEMIDMSSDDALTPPVVQRLTYAELSAEIDKAASSTISRSQSSSVSSLDNINTKEAIQCLAFADAYLKKSDMYSSASLWVGTNCGSILVISLSLPPEDESRKTEPVIASLTGTIFRLKGCVKVMSFLDCGLGVVISASSDQYSRDDLAVAKEKKPYYRQQSVANLKNRMSPTMEPIVDRQFVIVCSEKQARVIALPSQTCAYKVKITETSAVAKADVITIKDGLCLACYLLNGHLMTFSLPSLRPLMDADHIPFPDVRVAPTFCFSLNCQAMYMCSPSEIQKLTLSAEVCETIKDMLGELFLPRDMPEAPKQGFLKSLFSVTGSSALDRQELFGESKAAKGVATYTSGMSNAQEQAGVACSEIGRAKQLAMERGEKLGELEDKTERMKLNAEVYASTAHQLKMKYQNKKWYQL